MMDTWQDRVKAEWNELGAKITKLYNFLENTDLDDTLSSNEVRLLNLQLSVMRTYADILSARLYYGDRN